MPFHYKALVIVMFLTTISFALAKPAMTRVMGERDFDVRRNAWLALTFVAFVMPEFWSYLIVSGAIIVFAAKKDSNPVALFVFLMLVIPPVSRDLPGFGIVAYIIPIDNLRLLSILILLPIGIRLMQRTAEMRLVASPVTGRGGYLLAADTLLVMYLALQVLTAFPHQSVTATIRMTVELALFTFLPYFVVSRSCDTREKMVETMAAFALSTLLLVPLAIYEVVRGAQLYGELQARWDGPNLGEYLTRGDFLRAQVTAGHSIVLGVSMSVSLGLWLFLQDRIPGKWRWLGYLALVAGNVCALSRGPWVGALVCLTVYLLSGPDIVKRASKGAALVAALSGIALVTPYRDTIVDYLPFIGTADSGSVTYRQEVAARSWDLIMANPFLGNPYYIQNMEELRQGQGIIDIVNSYAAVGLSYGLIGAGLFVGFFAVAAFGCWRATQRWAQADADMSLMGASLLATLLGLLTIIATVSQILSIPYLECALAGMALAFVEQTRIAVLQRGASHANLSTA